MLIIMLRALILQFVRKYKYVKIVTVELSSIPRNSFQPHDCQILAIE